MLSLGDLSQRRFPVLLALVAVLMLFIAPEISKSLQRNLSVSGEMTGHDRGHPAHSSYRLSPGSEKSATPSGHHADRQDLHHTMMPMAGTGVMDDSACGYCQLLIHLPFLSWVFIPFIWLTLVISRPPPEASFAYIPFSVLTDDCQPRAPPGQSALR